MSHEPELLASAYLDGMGGVERRRFERHLLECEQCWQEVSLGRRGRALAESIRDRAPAGIRDSVRAAVTAAASEQRTAPARPDRRHLVLTAALTAVLAAVVSVGMWRPWQHTGSANMPQATPMQSTLAVAVASFRDDRLPGTAIPDQPAPDLTPVGLHLIGAAVGTIADNQVTAFAYRTDTGTRLDLYRSSTPIPETGEAEELGGVEGAWRTELSGIIVICGGDDHTQLLISADRVLIRQTATMLRLI